MNSFVSGDIHGGFTVINVSSFIRFNLVVVMVCIVVSREFTLYVRGDSAELSSWIVTWRKS